MTFKAFKVALNDIAALLRVAYDDVVLAVVASPGPLACGVTPTRYMLAGESAPARFLRMARQEAHRCLIGDTHHAPAQLRVHTRALAALPAWACMINVWRRPCRTLA